MASPVFRVTLITLIAAGVGGGLLYRLQTPSAPVSRVSTLKQPALSTEPSRTAAQSRVSPDDSYAEFFQSIGPIAFTTNPRPAPPRTAPASPAPDADDDFTIPLPLAREALASVGIDDLSEAIWELAINDPSLAPEDRQDLIEDLNQEGFADPENPTKAELPLIEARLALIDLLAPEAMDQTNADAFAEAKKDLEQMRARLSGMGLPAQLPGASGASPKPAPSQPPPP